MPCISTTISCSILSPVEAPHDVAVSSNVEFNIAPLGGNAILQCSAKGGPNNTYEWQKDGIILSNETGDILNLYGISPAAGGFYNCTVSNAAGNDSASIAIIGKYCEHLNF